METDKYKYCNHHHELTDKHTMVNIEGESIVANVDAASLLNALNELGLRTRTHHIVKGEPCAFVSIILDEGVQIEVKTIDERDSTRTKYNGLKELLISWNIQKLT